MNTNHIKKVFITLFFFVAIFYHAPTFIGLVFSNIAWISLSQTNLESENSLSTTHLTIDLFEQSLTYFPNSPSSYTGIAIAQTILGKEVMARSSWNNSGISPETLVQIGNNFSARGDFDRALTIYRNASDLASSKSQAPVFSAISVCQKMFSQSKSLRVSNQHYCQTHFDNNEQNLITNGDFLTINQLQGWGTRYFSGTESVHYVFEESEGTSYLVLDGLTSAYHGGVYQTISIPENTELIYSAWIKFELENDAEVRLLYFSGRQNAEPFGQQLNIEEPLNTTNWVYIERTLKIPSANNQTFEFFPALLTGRGRVYIDNVRLTIQ